MREGIREWRNPKNRLFVCRLSLDADPRKRSAEGKRELETIRANVGRRTFAREYLIDWASPEGEPVIPEFSQTVHVGTCPPDPLARLLRFWDFGFVSPVVLFAQFTPYGQLRFLRELCPFNVPLDQLLPMVFALTRDLVHDPQKVFDAGDPAATSQTDLGSAAEVLQKIGIRLHTNRPGTEVSYSGLRERFLKRIWVPGEGEIPAILIDPLCHNLIEACAGAFHLSPFPPYRPMKVHPFKDVVDAARYGNDNLCSVNEKTYQVSLRTLAQSDIQQTYGAY